MLLSLQNTRTFNSYALFKTIAIALMIIDHIGYYFYPDNMDLRLIGRFSFPLFFFLIGYSGYFKFKLEVLVAASIIFFSDLMLGENLLPLNILFSVVISRFICQNTFILTKLFQQSFTIKFLALMFVTALNLLLHPVIEYGLFGVLFIAAGFTMHHRDRYLEASRFLGFILLTYFYTQLMFFDFNGMHEIIFAGLLMVLLYLLIGFKVRDIDLKSDILNTTMNLIAKNSLWIFVGHVVLFKVLG